MGEVDFGLNVFQSLGQFRKFGTVIRRNGLENQGEQTHIGHTKMLDHRVNGTFT
jgi:hypothetical protein